MKMPGFTTLEPELGRLSAILRRVLSNISIDNFTNQVVAGTTSNTADSVQKFKHSLQSAPRLWLALEGDVYIPKDGIGTGEIDVRSTKAAEPFKIILLR